MVARTGRAPLSREDEQPAQGAALVPPVLFWVHSLRATGGAACFSMCSNAGSTSLCLTVPPCLIVVLLSCWVTETKLSHLSLNKYHFLPSAPFFLSESLGLSSRGYVGKELFAIDILLSAGLCIQPEEELVEYLPPLGEWSSVAECVS